MATPTLSELFTTLTRDQIVASALKIAEQVDLPVTAWESGSVGREQIVILCQLISTYASGASTTCAAAGLLDFAEDEWLDLTGTQVYETERIAATFGSCTEQLSNASATPYTISAGDVRFYNTRTGATYSNTTGGTLVASGTLNVTIQAEQSGSGSNASVGEISQLVTPITGVTCTNLTPLVGTDAEKDEAYRIRCRESTARLSPNGPRDAYNYFAKSTVRGDGSNAGVTRTFVDEPLSSPGSVIVYLASDAGIVGPSDVALVQTNLLGNCVPTGITCSSVSAVERDVLVRTTVYLSNGSTADPVVVRQAVYDTLVAYFQQIPIGGFRLVTGGIGYVFLDMTIAGIAASAPEEIIQVVVTSFSADIALAANEVAVLTTALSDISVVVAT